MFPASKEEFRNFDPEVWQEAGFHTGQFQHFGETRPDFFENGKIKTPGGLYDASLAEILHLITGIGYADAYPDVFGEKPSTSIAKCMDAARGGHFTKIPEGGPKRGYQAKAWYHYDDETCD